MKQLTVLILASALIACAHTPVLANDTVTAQGRVYEADGKTPLSEAAVVIYDERNIVIGHANTDAEGKYTIAVPREALHLPHVHHGGGNFLGGLVKGAGQVLKVAAPLAMTGLSFAATGGMAGLGGLQALAPSALQGVNAFGGLRAGSLGATPGRAIGGRLNAQTTRQMLAAGVPRELITRMQQGQALGDDIQAAPAPNAPGALIMKVTRADHAEVASVGQIYWLQEEAADKDSAKPKGFSAWVDPVQMASADSGQISGFKRDAFTLRNAHFDPDVVEIGQSTTLNVNLSVPSEPKADIVVVARNAKTGEIIEMQTAGDGLYKAEIAVDKKTGKNDVPFSILAYERRQGEEGHGRKAEEALNGAGLWDLKKPYLYNPLIAVTRNRADLVLTIVPANRK